jgi:hypothetical protein
MTPNGEILKFDVVFMRKITGLHTLVDIFEAE